MKSVIKKIPLVRDVLRSLDNQHERDDFVIGELKKIPAGRKVLDAGCGSQRYREYCAHLDYKAQDFGQYVTDDKKMMGGEGVGGVSGYQYGKLDYIGDIWSIDEQDESFDFILCTEVFEHIPFPNETVTEFSRLLKKGGKLILTAPSNCLRHMDPYYFYAGLSDRWHEKILVQNSLKIDSITPVGDYYRWLAVEMARTALSHSFWSKLMLGPAFLYFYSKKKTQASVDTLCMGYHVVATKV